MHAILLALGPIVLAAPQSMRARIELYEADRGSLERTYSTPLSSECRERMRRFHTEELAELEALDLDALARDERVDWLLLRNELRRTLRALEREAAREAEAAPLMPFAPAIVALLDARRRMEPVDPQAVAETLHALAEEVEALRERLAEEPEDAFAPTLADRAARLTDRLRRALERWHAFRDGYDPLFTWWTAEPQAALSKELREHAELLRERFAGTDDEDALVGDPIGREALLDELAFEWIPYAPEELVAIAERELAWCDAEMLRASRELGFGEDWRAAQDHVKGLHAAPGRQPRLIRELAEEAIRFLESRELVTIPPLAVETWRMEMMSPERQRTSPYFLGGETILVSFPTADMAHEDKLMSLRGNNEHFARATVHHELIPGHHLQGFMNARHRPWRRTFRTPFWIEGWALYWELRLWDMDFARGPEDRVGMLFWRKHRCARILFSLSFHLGELAADECVDLLVERVGHERRNAEAEVRRSVAGGYGPLYQCAYMLGGLQLRALHEELVAKGGWTERAFHDAVLERGPIPIELLRAELGQEPLSRDLASIWRFAE